MSLNFCDSLYQYKRRKSVEVNVGGLPLGGDNPIRLQSMTTADTMDTKKSVEECLRLIEAGCEYIRLTAPSMKEAKNLALIKKEIRQSGYQTPLIADIHFTPNAAEIAARIVEKVRVNPGNFVDKKKFKVVEYTDFEYEHEIEKIRQKFIPLINICKEYGTAIRVGTNHGSLSDRIINRYGDNPIGMVESALEFLRICEEFNYHDVVVSMKSSNPQVMVYAYRLLVQKLREEGLKEYPLHLGVTEAGEAEDGRVKSALGIGTLLEDGLGDTVRVSLTEAPEFEIPVARKLVERYDDRNSHQLIEHIKESNDYSPFNYKKRKFFHEKGLPSLDAAVIADFSGLDQIDHSTFQDVGYRYMNATDKWSISDTAADYVYLGQHVTDIALPGTLRLLLDWDVYKNQVNISDKFLPYFTLSQFIREGDSNSLAFVYIKEVDVNKLKEVDFFKNVVFVLESNNSHNFSALRNVFFNLEEQGIESPVILKRSFSDLDDETLQLHASTDLGGVLIDGYGNGVWLNNGDSTDLKFVNGLAFGILQAARLRMVKAEYISCPSCGRTLFDLQETTAKIRSRTDHLKGVKIGVMGCIVNGPGEMADADYGYVGSGKGKITLYKGQEVIKRGVPSESAVDELIELIKEDNHWIEPK